MVVSDVAAFEIRGDTTITTKKSSSFPTFGFSKQGKTVLPYPVGSTPNTSYPFIVETKHLFVTALEQTETAF